MRDIGLRAIHVVCEQVDNKAGVVLCDRLRTNTDGFTLIEIIITIIVLGSLAGIMAPFFLSSSRAPDPVLRERAISMGQAMMDEILSKRWDESSPLGGGPICTQESPNQTTRPSLIDACLTTATPAASFGPDSGEARIDFDDVDDYHGINETNNFTDQNGVVFAMNGYQRQVTMRYIASGANPIDQNTPAAGAKTDTKLIIVSITSPLGETFNLISTVCNL